MGIGAAMAKAFAAEAASVVVNYIQNEDAAEGVVADCKEHDWPDSLRGWRSGDEIAAGIWGIGKDVAAGR